MSNCAISHITLCESLYKVRNQSACIYEVIPWSSLLETNSQTDSQEICTEDK
jgi:hypothetical protein